MTAEAGASKPGTASPQPLRTDDNGQPVYPEWNDEWSVPVVSSDEETDEQVVTQVKTNWDDFRKQMIQKGFEADSLLGGVEKVYSTGQAARFFGRTNQWLYWVLRNDIATYKDGTPIKPQRGDPNGRRRFTLPIIREIALSLYRRGNLTEEELQAIMAKILIAEFGEKAFA